MFFFFFLKGREERGCSLKGREERVFFFRGRGGGRRGARRGGIFFVEGGVFFF